MLAVIMAFVLVPLAAIALSSLTRSASVSELRRAADSGALAGAASIPLGDLASLPNLLFGQGPPQPLSIACEQALKMLDTDDAVGEDYAGEADCDARYLRDTAFLQRFGRCLDAVGERIGTGPPPIQEQMRLLEGLLPALAKPGIEVTLTRTFAGGPLDDEARAETLTSAAVRRFKNLIVTATIAGQQVNDRGSINALLDDLEDQASLVAPECAGAVAALQDDYNDASKGTGGYSDEEILEDAQNGDASVIIARLSPAGGDVYEACGVDDVGQVPPPVPFPTALPTIDPTAPPQPPPPPVDTQPFECFANARGAFRASLVRL